MKVLIACEESQTVCKAFRAKGHEAYSCDIIEPSGGHPFFSPFCRSRYSENLCRKSSRQNVNVLPKT